MTIIYYHKGCPDGFCAAWLMSKMFPDAKLVPTSYDTAIKSPVTGSDVYFVDFCPTAEALRWAASIAATVTVLDHHESRIKTVMVEKFPENVKFECSTEMSGARLAYYWLLGATNNPELLQRITPAEWLVDYVEDRDLWRHKLPKTQEINVYIESVPHVLLAWDQMLRDGINFLITVGEQLLVYKARQIEMIVGSKEVRTETAGRIEIVNSPILQSDIGSHLLDNGADLAVIWSTRPGGKVRVSLRSRNGWAMQIATRYPGGGGHPDAAGFTTSWRKFERDFLR